ncbi:hypothetical protein GE21DRAFT_1209057, partial [Neurospora crassa]
PFEIIDKLLYNINLIDKVRRIYIPKSIIVNILNVIHNEKHYFGRDCIMYNFKDYIIIRKI